MRLLVFTQALDRQDPTLSAYHRLVLEIAKNFESVIVICLKKGDFQMPKNVRVLSLGKEEGESRFKYLKNLYTYVITERNNYDSVFVHMNQEYILLAGFLWKVFKKDVYMWRNHHAGSFLTKIAVAFCKKVFCTSKFSYTAKFYKTVLMPVGIDTDLFKKIPEVIKEEKTILFLARIAPVKKPHVLVEALKLLSARLIPFTAYFYGDPLPADEGYYVDLKNNVMRANLSGSVHFKSGVPNTETVKAYNESSVFVNLSSSGMYDKTIFEAMACETLTLASNLNLQGLVSPDFIFEEDNEKDLALKLERLISLSAPERNEKGRVLREVVLRHHSIKELGEKLVKEIS